MFCLTLSKYQEKAQNMDLIYNVIRKLSWSNLSIQSMKFYHDFPCGSKYKKQWCLLTIFKIEIRITESQIYIHDLTWCKFIPVIFDQFYFMLFNWDQFFQHFTFVDSDHEKNGNVFHNSFKFKNLQCFWIINFDIRVINQIERTIAG